MAKRQVVMGSRTPRRHEGAVRCIATAWLLQGFRRPPPFSRGSPRMGQIAPKSGHMSCWSAGVALGILGLLLCDGPGCGLHLDLSNSGTPAGLARVRKTAEEMDPIFVHIGAKEITIPCMSSEMDVVIGMNPTYNWSLENEEPHPLSGGASLTLHDFHTDDSGEYVCTVSYTMDGQLHTKTFYHTVVGYHIRAELHVLLLFQCNSCEEELTHSFLKTLREHLSEVVQHLHCELLLGAISCFPTVEKPLDEFNFQYLLLGRAGITSAPPRLMHSNLIAITELS